MKMAKATAEIEVQVSKAKIIDAEVRSDGTCKLTVELESTEETNTEITTNTTKVSNDTTEIATKKLEVSNDMLELVEASKLRLDDKFMQYEPEEETDEEEFKKILTRLIQSGTLKDFWRPKMDPSFDETGYGICYVAGKIPAVGKSKNWWKEAAKRIGLQLGGRVQYIAFLGFLIKKLVEEGWSVADAWYAVCSDSKNLGHYYNSGETKHKLEMTGSREVCKFFDLGNTFKILATEEEESVCFWLAGGNYFVNGCTYPLTDITLNNCSNSVCNDSVGWLVLNT